MKTLLARHVLNAVLLLSGYSLLAADLPSATTANRLHSAEAVFRGEVATVQSYQDAADHHVYTRTVVRVEEVFKGKVPAMVFLVNRGGTAGSVGEANDLAPQFAPGQERLFFVRRGANGKLTLARGESSSPDLIPGRDTLQELRNKTKGTALPGADVTDNSAAPDSSPLSFQPNDDTPPFSGATNLISGPNTIGPRFLQQDRGESIPYLIDVTFMDPALTVTQGVAAVQQAIAAWSSVTSLKFTFAGLQDFGTDAADAPAGDGVLRIQLHDHYKFTGGGQGDGVAVGGQGYVVDPISSGWTGGGNVIGNDFYHTTSPWVIVQTTNTEFHDPVNLAECLGHEIGHALGLAHSSNDPNETNQLLSQAIMYFALHLDGRGARLNEWDTNDIQQIYPFNTPPYAYGRILNAIDMPTQIFIPGVNSVEIPGFDLQTPTNNLVFETSAASSGNGFFTNQNNVIFYVPNGFFGDQTPFDPTSGEFYDIIYARFSDGTNASPYVAAPVLAFYGDSYSEGVPDSWRSTYFGDPSPFAGPNRHATNDFDGDGYSNLQEFLFGSDPTDKTSNLRITSFSTSHMQWQAKAYEVYEVYSSTNLKNWQLQQNPLTPTNSTGVASNLLNGNPKQFFRVMKVP